MRTNKAHHKKWYIRMVCTLMCMFYVLGLFQGPLMELFHEASHIFAPKTHHHNFSSDHVGVDYSSLEAMAGHSHEALEVLKVLLENNSQSEHDTGTTPDFKLNKHLPIAIDFVIQQTPIDNVKKQWAYLFGQSKWSPTQQLPPPKNV